ncbi:hypothetical protein PAXRUDRAFT_694027 [Paxillus rubicundulus Ve08.2h10]|uniref:Uncharacterized protein n=1 Tax=Paxillus rubicundulus Ve08.2h10 TaxID=930991 RepID=A0A0D0DKP8_9AGAM|nr:hypothetical protein PAXRUDRAFT_694027 [Paxillus rubicundulus Ve08.2h10]
MFALVSRYQRARGPKHPASRPPVSHQITPQDQSRHRPPPTHQCAHLPARPLPESPLAGDA